MQQRIVKGQTITPTIGKQMNREKQKICNETDYNYAENPSSKQRCPSSLYIYFGCYKSSHTDKALLNFTLSAIVFHGVGLCFQSFFFLLRLSWFSLCVSIFTASLGFFHFIRQYIASYIYNVYVQQISYNIIHILDII